MCIGVPMKIKELELDIGVGTLEVDGVEREVNLSLLDPEELEVGKWVLVHAGFGVTVVDESYLEEARATIAEVEEKTSQSYKSW